MAQAVEVKGDESDMPLGYPTIRLWELDENSTRYDRIRAAPSDAQLETFWLGYTFAFFFFTSVNLFVFLAVLLKKKTRSNAFNQYLLALMLPDIIFTGTCAINCAILVANGGFFGAWCQTQSFYIIWCMAANCYVNAVIAYEVQNLLEKSHRRQRYFPPSRSRIAKLTLACYTWATFLAVMTILPMGWWPHKADSNHGIYCVPLEYDTGSTVFFWALFLPLLCGVPICYACYVGFQIMRKGRLPSSGKKREIAVFFLRIFVVLLVMWVPSIVGVFAAGSGNVYVAYIFGLWSHSTGFVSAIISTLKTDVREAVWDLLYCRTWQANRDFDSGTNGSRGRRRTPSLRSDFNNTRDRRTFFAAMASSMLSFNPSRSINSQNVSSGCGGGGGDASAPMGSDDDNMVNPLAMVEASEQIDLGNIDSSFACEQEPAWTDTADHVDDRHHDTELLTSETTNDDPEEAPVSDWKA